MTEKTIGKAIQLPSIIDQLPLEDKSSPSDDAAQAKMNMLKHFYKLTRIGISDAIFNFLTLENTQLPFSVDLRPEDLRDVVASQEMGMCLTYNANGESAIKESIAQELQDMRKYISQFDEDTKKTLFNKISNDDDRVSTMLRDNFPAENLYDLITINDSFVPSNTKGLPAQLKIHLQNIRRHLSGLTRMGTIEVLPDGTVRTVKKYMRLDNLVR